MNLTTWAIGGILVITVFAIISLTGVTSLANVNDQFAKINCPMPIYSGLDFLNGTVVNSLFYLNHNSRGFGTYYQCFFDSHTMAFGRQGVTSITASYVNYNSTTFGAFPEGWFHWAGDFMASFGFKVGAVVNLISYILTPINFSFLGFTLSNIGGAGLLTVIAIYVFAYVPICIYMYKAISPFAMG